MQHPIITITPHLPPKSSGVADYAFAIAQELRKQYQRETVFITLKRDGEEGDHCEGFPVHRVGQKADELAQVLSTFQNAPIYLHYSGYGYHQRGCPQWLLQGIENAVGKSSPPGLMTMFHEVSADDSPPWTKAFWFLRKQQRIAKGLAKLSTFCLANTSSNCGLVKEKDESKVEGKNLFTIPVFSTVGESARFIPFDERERKMIIFGAKKWREQMYQRHGRALNTFCKKMSISEVVDIGSPVENISSYTGDLPIQELGRLPAEEIHSWMEKAMFAASSYPLFCLGKSTIFASYAAHGLVTVLGDESSSLSEGLQEGRDVIMLNSPPQQTNDEDLEKVGRQLFQWYQDHKLNEQVRQLEELAVRLTQ